MSEAIEIAKRLREEVRTVEKMAFALKLVFPQADMMIQSEAHCLIEWMKDAATAIEALLEPSSPAVSVTTASKSDVGQ
jgi:hypothetical protein